MVRFAPLQNNAQEFNTGDSSELGVHPKELVDSLNAFFGQAGVTTVNFGAYPGTHDASVAVSGQTDIVAGSVVQAWLVATTTTDHSADEHWVDPPIVVAGDIVAGTGFTIHAIAKDGGRAYGQYTVHWKWL